jgi:hypothetical protein
MFPSGATIGGVKELVFADAIGLAAIALADLTADEVSTENVVHSLVVTEAPSVGAGNGTRVAA